MCVIVGVIPYLDALKSLLLFILVLFLDCWVFVDFVHIFVVIIFIHVTLMSPKGRLDVRTVCRKTDISFYKDLNRLNFIFFFLKKHDSCFFFPVLVFMLFFVLKDISIKSSQKIFNLLFAHIRICCHRS